jgi:hypothetical protein
LIKISSRVSSYSTVHLKGRIYFLLFLALSISLSEAESVAMTQPAAALLADVSVSLPETGSGTFGPAFLAGFSLCWFLSCSSSLNCSS